MDMIKHRKSKWYFDLHGVYNEKKKHWATIPSTVNLFTKVSTQLMGERERWNRFNEADSSWTWTKEPSKVLFSSSLSTHISGHSNCTSSPHFHCLLSPSIPCSSPMHHRYPTYQISWNSVQKIRFRQTLLESLKKKA